MIGTYIAATTDQLTANTAADKVSGAVSQKALFRRRGTIELTKDSLILSGWDDSGDLVLKPAEIVRVDREYTNLYGRFLGGLLDRGKPLILGTTAAGEIYLLIDRREFMETTTNRRWQAALDEWLADHATGPR